MSGAHVYVYILEIGGVLVRYERHWASNALVWWHDDVCAGNPGNGMVALICADCYGATGMCSRER